MRGADRGAPAVARRQHACRRGGRSPRASIASSSANHPGLLTIIVPRHPARGDAIGAMLTARGLRVARRAAASRSPVETDIYLADTMGELGLFYRLAGIAFIGGSLVAKGGHNPFEAARLDCAVLHGPDMSNCAGMAAALGGRRRGRNRDRRRELARAVAALLADRPLRPKRAAAGSARRRGRPRHSRRGAGAARALARSACAGARHRRAAAFLASLMRTAPGFWGEPPGVLANLLLPIGAAWDAAGRLRARAGPPLSRRRSRWCASAIWSPAAPARPRSRWRSPPARRARRRGAYRDARLWRPARRAGAGRPGAPRCGGGRRRGVAACRARAVLGRPRPRCRRPRRSRGRGRR